MVERIERTFGRGVGEWVRDMKRGSLQGRQGGVIKQIVKRASMTINGYNYTLYIHRNEAT